jgi:predicted secreted hydrolase
MKLHPVTFPADSQAHESIIEWWYFNGHLKDKAGNHYGFMDCLFKVDAWRTKIPHIIKFPGRDFHFAHSMLCDIDAQKNYKSVNYVTLLSRGSFKKPMMYAGYFNPLSLRGFKHSEIKETGLHNFHLKTENFSLDLKSRKNPLLIGGKGYAEACNRKTFYYSLTDMKAKGSILIKDKWIDVEGKAWMDHVWADVASYRDRWTWFSFQLDNGTDIMCIEYDDGKQKECLVDMIHADGTQEHFRRCVMRHGKEVWKSRKTKASYPLNWEIEIPEKKMVIDAKPLMSDQEMIFGVINYWECPLKITAHIDGKKVKGQGFVELANYPSHYNYLLLVTKNMFEGIKKFFKR